MPVRRTRRFGRCGTAFSAVALLMIAGRAVLGYALRPGSDNRPGVVFVIAEDEYKTETTLPEFAARHLGEGFRSKFILGGPGGKDGLPGIEAALEDADVAVLSVRRRALPKSQMAAIRRFVAAGRPVVGIRTASHAFSTRGDAVPKGLEAWSTFDAEVLGGSYHGHHGPGPEVALRAAPDAGSHPILSGVDLGKLAGRGSLYKVSPLAKTTTALLIGSIPGQVPEPVAWTNARADGGRTFYTSLGHPDDFRQPEFNALLRNAIAWAAGRDVPGPSSVKTTRESDAGRGGGPPSPAESLRQFKVADDLEIDQLLAEPRIAQPVFLNFDERGRMWVVEYRQYPEPAGLTMLSRDGVWRVTYDKVSPPPPRQFRGADRITIHEDTDGDGRFDSHKTFVDGLNIATACARGRGGVWVLNPPYLLFYPDKDNDDVPDGDPVVCLEGFGFEDTHAVVNSLRWGPDGWLYAAQGSTVSGRVKRPGSDDGPVHSLGQLLWRYHPESRRYEIFAEGGGNTFGVELDAKGRAFSGHNGGDTRGFHYVQGGYYRKGFDKHGPLSNPYTYGYFPAMEHARTPRFTHTFIIYDGGALPEHYNGKLFGVATLLNHVVLSEVIPDGSTFRTRDLGLPIATTDEYFRPVDIKLGPDGALYVADWFDRQTNHYRNHEGKIDKTNGRIYRLKAKGARPIVPFDLSKQSSADLVALLEHPNQWFRQTALRLLGDRKDRAVVPELARSVRTRKGQPALEALWALNLCGGLDDAIALELLDHVDPFVRLWTVRLLCDPRRVSPEVASKLSDRARLEPDVEARSQLACSARRLPGPEALPIVRNLIARDVDADDPHIPLLLWWAIESKAETDRDAVLALFREPSFWAHPIVRRTIAERAMRRFAASGARQDLLACAELLKRAPGPEDRKLLMTGLESALTGRSLVGLPDELAEALARSQGGSVLLGVRRGRPEAVAEALRDLEDDKADPGRRLQYARLFGEVDVPRSVPALLALACHSPDNALRAAALSSLQRYHDPNIPGSVLDALAEMTEDVRGEAFELLSSRPDWSLQLLQAVDSGRVDPRSIPPPVVRRLQGRRDERMASLIRKHFADVRPATTAELQSQIDRVAALVRSGHGDPRAGEHIFTSKCISCHALFGKGGKIGPDLTSYKRDELGTMLLSIINPSAEIREGYMNYVLATVDGRTLGGLLIDQDPQIVVLRNAEGRDVAIRRDEIEELTSSPLSLMPEGLLKGMTDREVRDLFAYLRATQPPK